VEDVRVEAKGPGIELVFLPPYSPDLNPIEYIWKSIKRVISTTFIRHMDDMRNTIKEAFYRLTKKLGLAAAGLDKFLAPCFNYTDFCRLLYGGKGYG
jgi:putative transposase